MIHRMSLPLPALLLLVACGGNKDPISFPPGLEMLESLEVQCPGGSDYPEQIATASGEADEYHWSHGCGYVHAPIEDVYLALLDSEVAVDQRSVDDWVRTDGVEPDYENSFELWNTVNDLITIEYDTTWRFGPTGYADDESMNKLGGRYQMTQPPAVITLMEGSVQAEVVEDGITKVKIIDHLDALRGGVDITEPKVTDLYDDIVAHVNGRTLDSHRDE